MGGVGFFGKRQRDSAESRPMLAATADMTAEMACAAQPRISRIVGSPCPWWREDFTRSLRDSMVFRRWYCFKGNHYDAYQEQLG